MNIQYYTEEQFIVAVKPYEEIFNTELMTIKNILKLKKWGSRKKIKYVIMEDDINIIGFARIQSIKVPKDLISIYFGKYATRFIQYLYDIQDVFIFSKYRDKKLCNYFITNLIKNAPVEKLSLFVVSVDVNNLKAYKCYKHANFIEIEQTDQLAIFFDNFWHKYKFKHLIISKQQPIKDNEQFNMKVAKLIKDVFSITKNTDDIIYLKNASGIILYGPGALNVGFFNLFALHFRSDVEKIFSKKNVIFPPHIHRHNFVREYIWEITTNTRGPVTKFIEKNECYGISKLDKNRVKYAHEVITKWAYEVI